MIAKNETLSSASAKKLLQIGELDNEFDANELSISTPTVASKGEEPGKVIENALERLLSSVGIDDKKRVTQSPAWGSSGWHGSEGSYDVVASFKVDELEKIAGMSREQALRQMRAEQRPGHDEKPGKGKTGE